MIFIILIFFCSGGGRKKNVNLSIVSVQATNIPPKETVVYTKQTQTQSSGGHERDGKFFFVVCFVVVR